MFISRVSFFLISLLFYPSLLIAQSTNDTVDTIDTITGTDGAGATSGWWWFWVVVLLAIVGISIWWAAHTGATPASTRHRSGGTPGT